MPRSTFRRKGKPMPPEVMCHVHPSIEAKDKKLRLCVNCLAAKERGKVNAARPATGK